MKLLLAEDDRDMQKGVSALLSRSNYSVDAVSDGRDAYDHIVNGDYDGAVLDIMMPGMSGTEVVKALRREGNRIPVLLLTAMDEVEDRIKGLDAGADDYLPKPFDGGELVARVRAMLRRNVGFLPDTVRKWDITLDRGSCRLSCGSRTVLLQNKAFQMIEMMMLSPGRIIPANEFMDHIWGWDSETEINVIWVNISYLRRQLEAIGSKVRIRAVRGVGYLLEEGEK